MKTSQFLSQIRQHIANDLINEALNLLHTLLENSPRLEQVIMQSARFQNIREQIRLGVVSHEDATLTKNQIRAGLLDLLQEIEDSLTSTSTLHDAPAIREEVEQAVFIVNSKNVMSGSSIHAGGAVHVHIGDKKELHKHYHVERKIPHNLTEHPHEYNQEGFIGREVELNKMYRTFFPTQFSLLRFFKTLLRFNTQPSNETGKLLLLSGEGGIGKTVLAAQFYRLHEKKYGHVAWILNEPNISKALTILEKELDIDSEEVESEEERTSLIFKSMLELPAPCLLVIDNMDNLEDLKDCYMRLNQLPNFHILITTRISEFEHANFFSINGLQKSDALALFKKNYTKALTPAEQDDLLKIREAVGNNTLVIELLAKNLAKINRFKPTYSIAEYLHDLQEHGLLNRTQSKPVLFFYRGRGKMREEKPEDVIATMYQLSELSESEFALQALFAMVPPQEIVSFDILEHLYSKSEELSDSLYRLVQTSWLEYNAETNAYKCNPLIREVIRHRNPNLRQHCQRLVDALLEKLNFDTIYEGDNYDYASVYCWYAELVRFFFTKDLDFDMAVLCRQVGDYLIQKKDLNKALIHFEEQRRIAKELTQKYPDEANYKNEWAIACQRLGSTQMACGNLEQVLAFFEQYNTLEKELYEAYPQISLFKGNLANSFVKLGDTQSTLCNWQAALTFFEQAFVLIKELYETHPQNIDFKKRLAISYDKLGDTQSTLCNWQAALTFFEQAFALRKELYETYPQNMNFKTDLAISNDRLGAIQDSIGNLEQALTFFEQSYILIKELYEACPENVLYKGNLALLCQRLGYTQKKLGNVEQALTFFEQYNTLEKELVDGYPQNIDFKWELAFSYQRLSSTHETLGNLEKALTFIKHCNRLFKELYEAHPQMIDFKHRLAISYRNLGIIKQNFGNQNQVLNYFKLYSKLEKELHKAFPQSIDFKNNLALSYQQLGQFQSDMGKLNQALTSFKQFHKLEKELHKAFPQSMDFKNNLALSYSHLGHTESSLNNLEQALTFFEQCNRLFKELHENCAQDISFKSKLAISYSALGIFYRDKKGNRKKATEYFEQSYLLWKNLLEAHSDNVEFRDNFNWVKGDLGDSIALLGYSI